MGATQGHHRLVVGLTYLFSTRYLGLGLETIEASFRGKATDWYAFLVKPLFTATTLSFGGSGGIVTPIFFIGTTAGMFFAMIMNLNLGTFAAIGLVSVLAGAANTPIAAKYYGCGTVRSADRTVCNCCLRY